jgi:uncharacterized protein (TIGR00369 family)
MQFEVRNPEFRERTIESFNNQAVMHTLNASIGEVDPGRVAITLPYRQDLCQQHGFIHAGILSTVLDSACGYAAFSLMPEDAGVLTIEFKINLLSPAKGELFRAVGQVVKPGRNVTVAEGQLYALANDNEKLIASMTGTLMSVYGRDDVSQ